MPRTALAFVCQSCGSAHSKWAGRCDDCGEWNSLVEEAAAPPIGASARRMGKGRAFALEGLTATTEEPGRRVTHVGEFDRVTGGGLVPGSALLIGGDPGVGKSTLVLQALAAYAARRGKAVYISGEEALAQVRLRAARMDVATAPVQLGSATCIEDILTTLGTSPPPGILAIDSIQTIWTSALDAAPGTIAQVRTATHDLVRFAKASGTALILVGHVTKDGQIAGPKAVEHLVDAVLYFEGERGHHAAPIDDAARGNDRDLHRVDDLRDQGHGGNRAGVAAGFGSLGDDEVDTAGHRVDGVANLAAHAADEDALGMQQVDRFARNAEPGHEKFGTTVDHRLNAPFDLPRQRGEKIDAERLVGQLADCCHLMR